MIFYAEDDGCVQKRSVMTEVLFYATLRTFQINKNVFFHLKETDEKSSILLMITFINNILFTFFICSHYLLQIACEDALHKKLHNI